MVTATLPPGRVHMVHRSNLLRSAHRNYWSTRYLTDRGPCRLEPRYELEAVEGESGLWIGKIDGPAVMIDVR